VTLADRLSVTRGNEMSEHRYIGSTEADDVELARLRLLEAVFDPTTTRHLEMLGVFEGWKCLEIGAGAGSVTQWLSMRVGSAGQVVATDIDTRFLQQLHIPNVEIRQHDIVSDALEAGHYDLAHCRNVLMHLLEPEKALKRMAAAVRSGGWLVIEETDHGSILSTDVTNPSALAFTTSLRAA
jgi:2-polyprenyl-3-methyl-5-hydroxy-6-metoxy-1,4-benzoquinol methylase